MKKIVLLSLIILCSIQVNAQEKLDSLWGVWHNNGQTDVSRLEAIKEISDAIVRNNPNDALVVTQMMLEFANDMELKRFQADALFLQGRAYSYLGDYSNTSKSYENSIKLYREIGDKSGEGSALAFTAGNLYYQGEYSKAIDYGNQVLDISKEINDLNLSSGVSKVIGHAHIKLGELIKAIDAYENGLKAAEQMDDKLTIGFNLTSIGSLYSDLEDEEKALEYFKRALIIYQKINDKQGIGDVFSGRGHINLKNKEYQEALDYFNRSLKLYKEVNASAGIGNTLYYIGKTYSRKGDFDEALEFFKHAETISIETDYKEYQSDLFVEKGVIYIEKGLYNKAIEQCNKGLDLSEKLKVLKSQKDACNCLYRANKLLLNNKLALNYHERVLSLNENLQIGKTSKTLQQMEYSQQKLRDSIANVERLRVEDERIAKVEAATDRRHRIQYSFIFGFVFLIFGFVLISRKISISNYYVEGLIFFAFLMLFEFMLVLISPFISSVTNGEPAFILFCNAVLAGLIIPIHGFFEKRLKQKIKK